MISLLICYPGLCCTRTLSGIERFKDSTSVYEVKLCRGVCLRVETVEVTVKQFFPLRLEDSPPQPPRKQQSPSNNGTGKRQEQSEGGEKKRGWDTRGEGGGLAGNERGRKTLRYFGCGCKTKCVWRGGEGSGDGVHELL